MTPAQVAYDGVRARYPDALPAARFVSASGLSIVAGADQIATLQLSIPLGVRGGPTFQDVATVLALLQPGGWRP